MTSKNLLPAIQSDNVVTFDLDTALSIPAGASQDELLELGVQAFNHSGMWMVRAGRCFMRFRDVAKNSEYLPLLEKRGIHRQHVFRAIKLAEFVSALPPAEAKRMLRAPYTKVLQLAQADPEVVEDLVESGELDDLTNLSVRQLRLKIKKLESVQQESTRKLQTLELEKRDLQLRVNNRHAHAFPPHCAIPRAEAGVQTAQIDACLDSLESVAETWLLGRADSNTKDYHHYRRLAAGTFYHCLRAEVARASALLTRIHEAFGDDITGAIDDNGGFLFTAEEVETFVRDRALILEMHKHEQKLRELARENSRPGKRGRKRKLKG